MVTGISRSLDSLSVMLLTSVFVLVLHYYIVSNSRTYVLAYFHTIVQNGKQQRVIVE
jgi:hypothetical protein